MKKSHLFFSFLFLLLFFSCDKPAEENKDQLQFTIYNKTLHPVSDQIFGQFMEKASWGGEIGGDAAIDPSTGKVYPEVMKLLQEMHIPNLRYPGGIDVDYYPWYNLIDNVPEIHDHRPAYRNRNSGKVVSDNRLGLDEFLALSEKLDAEPILVVNLGDAFFGKLSFEEAALNAAGFVAYCNADTGTVLPEGMPDWPAIRAKNGRVAPYDVNYFEVGNEPWLFKGLKMKGAKDSLLRHYVNAIDFLVEKMKEIDPNIEIICDGGIQEANVLIDEQLGKEVDYLAYHPYLPWEINAIVKDRDTIPVDTLSKEEIWNAWVATPSIDSMHGESVFLPDDYYHHVIESPYDIALTEWNWNGWWDGDLQKDAALDSKFAQGVGAAGWLHAMMRQGDRIKIGCQSMLVGISWGITAIRVDTVEDTEPVMFPTGKVTAFYSKYHGNQALEIKTDNMPFYRQPYKMNMIKPAPKVAFLDAVVTQSQENVFLHVINRNFSSDYQVRVNFEGLEVNKKFTHYKFSETKDDLAEIKEFSKILKNNFITIPAKSVNIFVFDRK